MSKLASYWQRGESLDYQNNTEALIPAGACVLVGTVLGVAAEDIPAGGFGALHVEGVYEIPKKAEVAIKAGAKVTYTEDNGIDAVSDTTTTVVGYAVENADASAATAMVKLLG